MFGNVFVSDENVTSGSNILNVCYVGCSAEALGEPNPELDNRCLQQSSACKVQVSEMPVDVCLECVKLHGGLGYRDLIVWYYLGDSQNSCPRNHRGCAHRVREIAGDARIVPTKTVGPALPPAIRSAENPESGP